MKIVSRDEHSMVAAKSLPNRLGAGMFLLALGVLLLFIAPLFVGIICFVIAGIFAMAAIRLRESITIDRPSKEIVLRKLGYGIFPTTRIMNFGNVEAVQVGYRRTFGLISSDWQVTLLLGDSAVVVTHGGNELRMRQLGSAISKLVKVKFVSDTFKPKNTFGDKGASYYSGIRQPPR